MGGIQDKEKIAELCGAIIGDGWIQSNEQCFFIAGDPDEDREYYDLHLTKIFREILIPVKPRDFPYWGVYGIGIYKKEIIKRLLKFDISKGKKVKTAKVPRWIINSNKRIIKSFLRGFFDADGSIFCQKDYTKYANEFNSKYHAKIRLRISSISLELIEQMYQLCNKCQFQCVKRTIKRGRIYGRNCNDVHIIEINHLKSIKRWFEELKPSNPKHNTKYLIWKKFGFCPPHTKIAQRKEILKNSLNPYLFYKQE